MNCGVCQQFTNSVVIYCFAGNLRTDKTSRDLKTGTTHWVCKDCYESMKENGTSGTCPYCRASNAGVSIYKQKAAVRAVYEFVDQE